MERALKVEKTRFDTKLTKVQKELFELATKIGGYRTLTDFMLSTAEEKAKTIVQQHEAILASERDKKIFFDAIMNPPQPNQRLRDAAKRYKEFNNQSAEA
ncbi:type II toxin-antitoxin system TacA family antitoxin [Mucilaginibacter sp.]